MNEWMDGWMDEWMDERMTNNKRLHRCNTSRHLFLALDPKIVVEFIHIDTVTNKLTLF